MTSPASVLPVPASAGANATQRITIGTRELAGGENKPLVETSSLLISKKTESSAGGVRLGATAPVANTTRGTAPHPKELVDPGLLAALQNAAVPANSKDPGLTPEEVRTVAALERRDGSVRQEEQIHAAQAGAFGGAPVYEYEVGPDGKRYAVAGEVPVHVKNPTGDAEQLARALAVLSQTTTSTGAPSAQDIAVAQRAARLAGQLDTKNVDDPAEAMTPPLRPDGTGRLLDIMG